MDIIRDHSLILDLPLYQKDGVVFQSDDRYGRVSTVTGAVWTPRGRVFDKVDDIITLDAYPDLNNLAAMTLLAWINPTSIGESTGQIMNKMTSYAAIAGWMWFLGGTNVLYFTHSCNVVNLTRLSKNNAISLGKFQMVAITWDGSLTATNIKHYVDGLEITYGTTTNGDSARESDATKPIRIGNDSATAHTFDGLIDRILAYNRILTPQEIQHNYLVTRGKYQ